VPISKRHYRIKHLLVLAFGGLALAIGLPIYLYSNHVFVTQLVTDRGDAINDLAKAVASVVAENLQERQREITLLTQTPLFRTAALDDPALKANLERVQKSYPHYSWIGAADLDGVVQSATSNILRGVSVRERPWFIHGLKGAFSGDVHEALLLSRFLPPPARGGPLHLIDFAAPLLDANGKVRGVLATHADWGWAVDVVKVLKPANAAQSSLEILIVNRENRVIHPEKYDDPVFVPASLTTEHAFVVGRWDDGNEYVASMVPVQDATSSMGWHIVVRQPTRQTMGDVQALQRVIMGSAALSVLIFIVLVWWGATIFSRPLRQLADQARKIEQGDENMLLTVSSRTVEINEVTDALRGMASTLLSRKEALAESNVRLEQTVAVRTAELAKANEELRLLARQDTLTRLPNRFAANERLRSEFVLMKRSHNVYAVLMMDVDYFKQVNDTHGHAVGDQVLQWVANILRTTLRESDFIARFGGEEFLALLPSTTLKAACQVAEKLRQAVESAPDPVAGRITLSIGIALASPEQADEDDAVRRADHWLYEAKKAGRNRLAAEILV